MNLNDIELTETQPLQLRTKLIDALITNSEHPQTFGNAKLMDIEIAVGEVIQNIIKHEKMAIGIKLKIVSIVNCNDNELIIKLSDNAEMLINTSFLKDKHETTEFGGMGIHLINSVTSSYEISATPTGNVHILKFSLT
jgi:anti-sigma regulatory factor (Ser/Thr protein kinase)